MAEQKFRIGGGYTAFTFNGTPLLYVEILSDTGPKPVSPPEEIQPLDATHPIEIATPIAHRAGTLTLSIREQWASPVWQTLPGYEGTSDIIEVFKRNVALGTITCSKIIRLPNGGTRQFVYHNCVITDISDTETVDIRTMTMPRTITLMYTHRTPN